jgi:hypothetical protein
MAIFPMSCVLRGFLPSKYFMYAEGKKPCAALLIKKIPHLGLETNLTKTYCFEASFTFFLIPF